MERKSYDTIPMQSETIISLGILSAMAVAFAIHEYPHWTPKMVMLLLFLPLCAGDFWNALKSYRLDTSGIRVFRLGRQIRFIPWDQVQQLGIAKRKAGEKRYTTPFILVVPRGCEPFDPLMDQAAAYCSRNWSMILTIDHPKKYGALFAKYYSPMDFDVSQYATQP